MDFSLPRPFAPRSKSSMCGTFASCNVRSHQWIQQGAKVPTKCIDLHIRNFRCHVTVKLARSAWTVLSRVVIQYAIIRCINEMDSLNVHSYSPLHLAYVWHTLWTIIIETSQLNVTQRRVFLRLFVCLYSSGAWQISSYLLGLSVASEVSFDCGRPTRLLFSARLGLYVLLNSATSCW